MRLPALALGLLLAGCQTEPWPAPVEGSTYRITDDRPADGSELRIDLLADRSQCLDAGIADPEACVPRVDRAHGEVRLAFLLRDPVSGAPVHRALDAEQIGVSHDGSVIDDFEIVPHDPVSGGQLFVLLIDSSGSMYENDGERIAKVQEALLSPEVVKSFFPDDRGRTGVVLLRFFGDRRVGLDGGPPTVVTSAAEYRRAIRQHLPTRQGGYTLLYDAAEYAVTELLTEPAIDEFLALQAAEPTIVLLTDGFHNEAPGETCADNVPRLSDALDVIRRARQGTGASSRFTLYTVGLGVPYRKGDKPDGFNQAVTPAGLCGPYADYPIDPNLEDAGIDHVSLRWLAEAGGGIAFTRRDPRGLAEVFQRAASTRYRWYELRYRVPDSFHHRYAFDVRVSLRGLARAWSELTILPGAWLDAPTGRRAPGERWTSPSPLRETFVLVVPVVGVLLVLGHLGPAWFNARRAIFRRSRPTSDAPPRDGT